MTKPYVKDWIIGLIEAEGSFKIMEKEAKAEFKMELMGEAELLGKIGEEMGISRKNKVSRKANNACEIRATREEDLEAVIKFITDPQRMRIQGIKKVSFLK